MGRRGKKRTEQINASKVPVRIGENEFEGLVSFEEISSYKVLKESYSGNRKRIKCVRVGGIKEDDNREKSLINKRQENDLVEEKTSKARNPLNTNKKKRKLNEDISSETPAKCLKIKGKVRCKEWESIFVPEPLIEALLRLGFNKPTEIQRLTIPAAIKDRRDIVGAAETGSGKTLAFGIPIICGILYDKQNEQESHEDEGIDFDDESAFGMCEPIPTEMEDVCEVSDMEMENIENMICQNENSEDELVTDQNTESDTEDEYQIKNDEFDDQTSEFDDQDSEFDEQNDEIDDQNNELDDRIDEQKEEREKLGCVKVINNANFDFLKSSKHRKATKIKGNKLHALIITPTRELAVQVKQHLDNILTEINIKTALVIGGMSHQKQQRILNKEPEIVVGTPGRLWELIQMGNPYLCQISTLRYLAIDETDRMLETGHFEELKHILGLLSPDVKRQKFIFSATLTMIHSAPKRIGPKGGKPKQDTKESKLSNLYKMVGIKGKPKVVDVTSTFGTAEALSEARIYCEREEKDMYLYYFLTTYPGRTLVFCNSIDCVRRLSSLLNILECKVQSLHAMKHQKQRLKSLEKFAQSPESVMLATDVAARGLDIRGIDHILHYEVPRTAETYVHRSGRTARANQEGLSVILVEPADMHKFRQLFSTLGHTDMLPPFPTNQDMMGQIRDRVTLAHKIETSEYRARKKNTDGNWLKKMAEEAGIEYALDLSDDERSDMDMNRKKSVEQTKNWRKQLKKVLGRPYVHKGSSLRYPTTTGKLVNPNVDVAEKKSALSVAKTEKTHHNLRLEHMEPKNSNIKPLSSKKIKRQNKFNKKKKYINFK